MLKADTFSNWLGIELLKSDTGYCKIKMVVRKDMLNGFGVLHGGVTYSFADSAFAFASNSNNYVSVSLGATINYPAPVYADEILFAEAKEISTTPKTSLYDVVVTKENDKIVCVVRGTAYKTSKKHF